MKDDEKQAIIEGLLFASGDEGLTIKQLSDVLNITREETDSLLDNILEESKKTYRGIMLTQSKSVFHLTTKPEHGEYFREMLESSQRTNLSQAALETLAIIAYNQPITRVEIEDIRGVNSDRSVKTLQSRSLVEEVGRRDAMGRPVLFATTKEFLFYFGLTSLAELPPLPTSIDQEQVEQETDLYVRDLKESNTQATDI